MIVYGNHCNCGRISRREQAPAEVCKQPGIYIDSMRFESFAIAAAIVGIKQRLLKTSLAKGPCTINGRACEWIRDED